MRHALPILVFLLIALSCNSAKPTEVIQTDRSYTWSIDSVDYESLPSTIQLESIWGSSPSDVWGAAGDSPDVRDCLWHYTGVKWSRATAGTPITDFTGNKVVYAVWGSARTDVWTVGRKINQGILSAYIMHYDGAQWADVTPPEAISIEGPLYTLYGVSRSDIWAGGYEYAVHFNGSSWASYKVGDSLIVGSISGNGKTVFATAYSPFGKNSRSLFQLVSNTFEQIDSTTDAETKFGPWLWAQESKLTTFANGVISISIDQTGSIQADGWHRDLTTATFFRPPSVQSPDNVFAAGQWNLMYHYNGIDWKPVSISVPGHVVSPKALFYGVWTDGKELFVCDTDNGIVYHGR